MVGATPEEMIGLGLRQVGKNFPVFIDPKTKEEYALARKEIKIGPGHDGFSFEFSPDVTLEEDLLRRDLTINAMALDGEVVIDPYGGQKDLEDKILKHVSKHFAEDPLRVLRVARFSALLHDFIIAPETMNLMKTMVESGELDNLTPERVYMEMERAMNYPNPQRFFEILSECGALKALFPELENLKGVEQTTKYHPEGDAWVHTMLVLKAATSLSDKTEIRFASLVHDFGKGVTPKDVLPKHTAHEKNGLPLIKNFCDRFKFPNKTRDLALRVCEYHLLSHKVFELKASTIIDLITQINGFRDESALDDFLICCEADNLGKLSNSYPQADYLRRCFDAVKSLDQKKLLEGTTGLKAKDKIREARIEIIKKVPKPD